MPMIPLLIGDPVAVPYGDFSIEEPDKKRLWWLSIAAGGNPTYVTIRTGSSGPDGVIRWQQAVPKDTTLHFDFSRPLYLERGLFINSTKAAIIQYGAS